MVCTKSYLHVKLGRKRGGREEERNREKDLGRGCDGSNIWAG